jgi:CRP-like cAMP-binding protein
MTTSCVNCPLRPRKAFVEMSADELAFMQKFKIGELTVDPGTQILLEGTTSPQLFTALYGLGIRYKSLMNGQRQVVNFVFPGDFIGLQGGLLREMQHTVAAATHMTLCVFARSELYSMFRSHPNRSYDLTWLAAQEEHFLGETLATVGQRVGIERIAWGFLKIYMRGEKLGLCKDGTMRFPFTQTDIADAFGLSQVHTNRLLRRLREDGLITWKNERLTIHDVDRLAEIAQTPADPIEPKPLF